MSDVDPGAQVSHEQNGRTMTGVGVSADQLAETMERHAPEPSPEAKGPAVAPTDGKPPVETPAGEAPPSRGRQRFADLTRERDEAKAAAEAAKVEREAIAKERDELKSRVSTPPAAREEPKPAAAAPPKRFPKFDDFISIPGNENADWYDWDDAKTAWNLQQYAATEADRVQAALSQREAHTKFVAAVESARERGRKAYPDFDTVLKSPAGDICLGRTEDEGAHRVQWIAQHPQSEHIQYAILKDAALATKIQQSDAYAFGALVASLVPAATPAKPAWTPPPAPHPTVGASSPTVAKSSAEFAKAGDYESYRAKRADPRLIEIAARLGGDRIATHLTPLSTGVDLVGAIVDISLGQAPDVTPKWSRGAAIRYFNARRAGTITALRGLAGIPEMRGFELLVAGTEGGELLQPGFRVQAIHSSLDRYGYAIFSGEDAAEAAARAERAVDLEFEFAA